MPVDPNTTLSAQLQNAPGADIPFDELFPVEGSPVLQGPDSGTSPQTAQQTQPEFFLKAGKSVYKTPEDAAQGVAHKDQLIDRYRAYLQEQNIDPDTLQTRPKQQAQDPNDPYTYLGKEGTLFDNLSAALQRHDKAGYDRTMQAYNQELLNAQLAPLAPLIAEVAQQRAVRKVSEEAKDFSTFRYSEDFNSARKSIPLLDNAIKAAESDYRMAEQLPDLYKMVYLISQSGRNRPEPVVNAASPQPAPSVRPTTAPSTMTPPPPGVNTSNWATSTDSRKQLIKDMEGRGIKDFPF